MSEINTVLISSQSSNNYKLYLCSEIGTPEEHLDVIQALQAATGNDTVDLYINNRGGYLSTTTQIIDAIKNCEAVVMGHLVGDAMSAGSIIFLACDSWRVAESVTLMIHNYSSGSSGKGHEMYAQSDYDRKEYPNFFRSWYRDFLSEGEMEDVLKGGDIYMTTDEIMERLLNLIEVRQERTLEEELAEIKEAKKKKVKKD